MKKNYILILLLTISFTALTAAPWPDQSPITDQEMQTYMLPVNHPVRKKLDKLFKKPSVLVGSKKFKEAGFVMLHYRPSTLIVASHPDLKGYLLKVHLRSSTRSIEDIWHNCARRCKGADNIKKFIAEKGFKRFIVADKWIYLPPIDNPIPILVVTDMNTVSKKESVEAWKTKVTGKHLREIFSIVKEGYSSTSFPSNIPYTKSGKFAFVDTECPRRVPLMDHAKKHLSEEMKEYWDRLVEKSTKT